jgi:GNAT superfamily N-acetyltransferase
MKPSLKVEHIEDIVDELLPLAIKHHAEVNAFSDTELDIDWRRYSVAKHSYRLITCRVDGKLVGWIGFFVYDHMRHKGYRIAKEDWYYVDPEYRGNGIGKGLFKYAENVLRNADVKRVMISCKVDHDHTGLIESLGYTNYEKNFTKVIA